MKQVFLSSQEMRTELQDSVKYNKFSEYYFYISLMFSCVYFLIPLCRFIDTPLKGVDFEYNYDFLMIICFISFIWSIVFGWIARGANKNHNLSEANDIYEIATVGPFAVALVLSFGSDGHFKLMSIMYLVVAITIDVYIHNQRRKKRENIHKIRTCMEKNYIEFLENGIKGYMYADISSGTGDVEFFVEYKDINHIYTQSFQPEKMSYYTLFIIHSQGVCMLCVEDSKGVSNILAKACKNGSYDNDNAQEQGEDGLRDVKNGFDVKSNRKIPVKPTVNEYGLIICPICGAKQNGDRYICFSCEQPFINGQPDIPFWCGNCGHKGPYDGVCPECQSSLKINNRID